MKRFRSLAALLLLILSLVALDSCEKSEPAREIEDPDAFLSEVRALLENSGKLNEIFYGKGLPVIDDLSRANGNYFEADPDLCGSLYGIRTVADLEALTRATFSASYADMILKTRLASVGDEDGIFLMARYYQKLDGDAPVAIMVWKTYEDMMTCDVAYRYETLAIESITGERVSLGVDVCITSDSGESETRRLTFSVEEEEDGLRITAPTFVSYRPGALEEYEKLKNKQK